MTIFAASPKRCRFSLFGKRLSFLVGRRFLADAGKFVLPPHVLYIRMRSLVGEEHARDMMACIEKTVCDGDAPIMEIRAGHGHLTKRLLDAGVKDLHVLEKRKLFTPLIKEIVSQYPERSVFHARTFNDVFFEDSNIPVFNNPHLKDSLPFICKKAWKDSPSFKVIGAHSSGKVMIAALAHISKNMMYYGMGRPQFILTVPTASWEKLMCNPNKVSYQEYQTAGLLFPDCYEYEILGKIAPPVKFNEGEATIRTSKEEFVIVSIIPHKDLEDMANPEVLEEYLFFATQTMNGKAKHSYVIPALEKWIPGCGKDLVISGVNCFTKFTELSAQEALRIFKVWKSNPNYKSSIFMYELKDYLSYNKY